MSTIPQFLLIFIIFALLSVNFVKCISRVVRAKRGSERNSWITESAHDWILESTESNEEEPPRIRSNVNYIFVGDMVFPNKNNDIYGENIHKGVVKNKSRIWPNKQMPVHIDSSVGSRLRRVIREAINSLEDSTCITFPKFNSNSHKHYVTIKSIEEGCWAFVGLNTDPKLNQINLETGSCSSTKTVIHELMHSLGVFHEQNRYDRDEYIEVLWGNLLPDWDKQYLKQSREELETFDEPYDYGSIMHYPVYGATRRGLPAFRVLRPYNEEAIGKTQTPSRIDLRKLTKLYGCSQIEVDDSRSDEDEPYTPRPTHPIEDESGESTGCDNGCCCTCKCKGLICQCNCPCTCIHYDVGKPVCHCSCNRIIFVPTLFNQQVISQNLIGK